MLKQEQRLKSRRSYVATYNNKNIISTDLIVAYVGKIKTDKNCPTRVGFVVSKKVHKRAVKRNKIKRLMRENIRLMLKNNELVELSNYQSLIFIAKNDILNKTFQEIRNTILILMDKLANKNI
ncbi:MAG: ribonuclease P protein component [Candidatus Gastranaerophilales bacterium]|nr:ribonuclease P protein component [Candidatus Gastranaerophilales bacterium]